MLERDTVAAYDYHARDSDELSLRRGEPLVVVAEAEPGWVHVRLPDGREGLVPHNHLLVYQSEGRTAPQLAEAGSDVETLGSEEETDFESLGQSRALPDWGYDHGVRFEGLQPEHPLWLQSALEGFVHALLFNTTAWGLADANVRTVMRHHHRGQQEKRECDRSPDTSSCCTNSCKEHTLGARRCLGRRRAAPPPPPPPPLSPGSSPPCAPLFPSRFPSR